MAPYSDWEIVKDGKTYHLTSVEKAARFMSTTVAHFVALKVGSNYPINGCWCKNFGPINYEYSCPIENNTAVMKGKCVVAHNIEKDIYFRFKSQTEAEQKLGVSKNSLRYIIKKGKPANGWEFILDDFTTSVSQWDKKFSGSFEQQFSIIRKVQRRNKRKGVMPKPMAVKIREELPGHKYRYGCYDIEYYPFICPHCKMIVNKGMGSLSANPYIEHLDKCCPNNRVTLIPGGYVRIEE